MLAANELELVLTHLDMALYAYLATGEAELQARFGDNIPYLYHMFASGTLLTTLFLTREATDDGPMGGYVYRVLKKHGHSELLDNIQRILSERVGATTFGDIIRINRNKLMVHGELSLTSLPKEVADVPSDRDAMDLFEQLMSEFVEELRQLRNRVAILTGA